MPNCCLKWSQNLKSNISWNPVFIKAQNIKDVKLKWLQMRIIHRIIATNIVLNKMGVTANTQLVTSAMMKKIALNFIFEM